MPQPDSLELDKTDQLPPEEIARQLPGLVRPSRPPQLSAGVLMEVIPSLSVDEADAVLRAVDQGRGRAIAQFAARDGHLEVIEALAKYHPSFAEWMKPDPLDGRSLIHHAALGREDCARQRFEVIQRLASIAKEKGVDPMLLVAPDCEGNTPFTLAARIHPTAPLFALSMILNGQEQENALAVLTAINQQGQTFADVGPSEWRSVQIGGLAFFSGIPSSVLELAIEAQKRRAEAGALGPGSSAAPGCETHAMMGMPAAPANLEPADGMPTGFSLAPPLQAAPDAAGQPAPPQPLQSPSASSSATSLTAGQ